MHRLCYALNQCTTLREVHLNIPYNGFFGLNFYWAESTFILSPTISRCTHFTFGGDSSARLFAIHTLAPISASCGLSHLSLELPCNIGGNQLGTMLETINQEAANNVISLSLKNGPVVLRGTNFWPKLVAKFVEIHSLRLDFRNLFVVSLFLKNVNFQTK